jgi:hypothetical protein
VHQAAAIAVPTVHQAAAIAVHRMIAIIPTRGAAANPAKYKTP